MGKTDKSKSVVATSTAAVSKKRPKKSIDGVSKSRKSVSKVKPVAKPKVIAPVAPTVSVTKPTMSDVVHPSQHRRQPQPSTTLMRRAVHKPHINVSAQSGRVSAPLNTNGTLVVPSTAIDSKMSVSSVDIMRLNRAKHVPKSKLVTRFNPQPAAFIASEPLQITAPSKSTVSTIPSTAAKDDIFTKAIHTANAHAQPKVPASRYKKHRFGNAGKVAGITAATLSIALIVGVLVYQNMSSIKLQLASSKAGFAATLPSQKPSGYSLANFSAASGIVSAHFRSNSDTTRTFTITEKESTWDSAALRDNYVRNNASNYQVVESGGRTIYLYNGNTATWVSGGIWYLVTNADSLSNADLIALATSM